MTSYRSYENHIDFAYVPNSRRNTSNDYLLSSPGPTPYQPCNYHATRQLTPNQYAAPVIPNTQGLHTYMVSTPFSLSEYDALVQIVSSEDGRSRRVASPGYSPDMRQQPHTYRRPSQYSSQNLGGFGELFVPEYSTADVSSRSYNETSPASDFYGNANNREHRRANSYSYPTSIHDPVSPTRSRFHPHNDSSSSANCGPIRTGRSNHYEYEDENIPKPMLPDVRPRPGPSNHVLVPQKIFEDPEYEGAKRLPHITFQMKGIPELGVRIGKVEHDRVLPDIVGANDRVLNVAEREIKIRILWPGYDQSQNYEKRVKTQRGRVTRATLLIVLSTVLLEYMHMMRSEKFMDDKFDDWKIGTRAEGDRRRKIRGPEVFVTRLVHRGGCSWQPELWIPNPNWLSPD